MQLNLTVFGYARLVKVLERPLALGDRLSRFEERCSLGRLPVRALGVSHSDHGPLNGEVLHRRVHLDLLPEKLLAEVSPLKAEFCARVRRLQRGSSGLPVRCNCCLV